jgi:hypothetical protein
MLVEEVNLIHLKIGQRLLKGFSDIFGFATNVCSIFVMMDPKFRADEDFGPEFGIFQQPSN